MNVVVSPYQNPFLNLALEDYFLRDAQLLPLCFLYVNRPSVILGRFQNPWKECHLPFLVQSDTWMVRRQSGGGCVYHDEGNLNFSFILPDASIDRRRHCELLKKAFSKSGIELQISERHDLWLQNRENEWRKVSGSAFKQTKFGSFHHGTMLVNSDLEKLEESLKHTFIPKDSKSIPSVRSKVVTLSERHPGIEIEDVIELICHELKTQPQLVDGALLSRPEVQESFNRLTSWEWLWGETPLFEMESPIGILSVRKGMVEAPFQAKFDRTNLRQILDPGTLERVFPDFSQIEAASRGVF